MSICTTGLVAFSRIRNDFLFRSPGKEKNLPQRRKISYSGVILPFQGESFDWKPLCGGNKKQLLFSSSFCAPKSISGKPSHFCENVFTFFFLPLRAFPWPPPPPTSAAEPPPPVSAGEKERNVFVILSVTLCTEVCPCLPK